MESHLVEKDPTGFFEPVLILMIIVANAFIGTVQENRAEKALEALKQMAAPTTLVIREGKEKIISSKEIVPGDIIKLEAGDYVPADARLLKVVCFQAVEATLTGEAEAILKNADLVIDEKAPLGDRCNMVYAGCFITYGTAMAVVTDIGMQTEMGKIAVLLDAEKGQRTPL